MIPVNVSKIKSSKYVFVLLEILLRTILEILDNMIDKIIPKINIKIAKRMFSVINFILNNQ